MKKFFIALSVLAALLIGVAPSQALVGMPDDQPGRDLIVPFICSTDLATGTGLNTLIAMTELGAALATNTTDRSLDYDWDVMSVRSVTVADGRITGTGHAVVSTDAKTLVAEVSAGDLASLEVTIDGTVYYAGYIYFEDNRATGTVFATNHVIAQFLYVNLAIGQAAGANAPMLEWNNNIVDAVSQANMTSGAFVEEFSPDALASAAALQEGFAPAANSATFFGLYPRFYIPASGDYNWLINYQCENAVVAGPTRLNNLDSIHINIYRSDEQVRSTNVGWPNEVNILNVEQELPSTLFASFPKEGWFDFRWDVDGGDFPDVSDIRDISIFAFNYMIANGGANEAWTVLNPVPRAADFRVQ